MTYLSDSVPMPPAAPQTPAKRLATFVSDHWLAVANTATGLFVGLPYLAPFLMKAGYSGPANTLYWAYQFTCHQFPSRSFFITGHQACLCHRCTAIWAAIFIGGLLFALFRDRVKPLPFQWWILFVIPIGLDGGTQLIGNFYELLPGWPLTLFALGVGLVLVILLLTQRVKHWQFYAFILCFPLAMAYVQFTEPRLSNWILRTVTGAIFGLGYLWLAYPRFEQEFKASAALHRSRPAIAPEG